jgi:hypothetical protein
MSPLHLPRLEHDDDPGVGAALRHWFWAACAVLVMLFILLAAIDVIEPAEAVALTIAVMALGLLWLAHAWRALWSDEGRRR